MCVTRPISMCAPRRFAVTQVELNDAGTPLVPASDLDTGTVRVWDIVTGMVKEENESPNFTFSESNSKALTVGSHSITLKGNFVLVYKTDTESGEMSDKIKPSSMPVAFFRAPARIHKLRCAGDKITVGCNNGEVLHLRAACLCV